MTRIPTRRLKSPSVGALAAIDASAKGLVPSDPEVHAWYTDYVRAHSRRLALDLDLIGMLDPEGSARILDVGAIPPVLLSALRAQGRRAEGVDVAPERFQAGAEPGPEISRCDIETEPLPYPGDTFDIVMFSEVFEHLRINLIETVRSLARVLTPAGMLCISTPNGRSARAMVNLVRRGSSGWCGAADIYAQYEKLEKLGHMGHVREYTEPDLRLFVERLGLRLQLVIWRGRDPQRRFRAVDRVFPPLSPLMTLVVTRG